LYNVDRQYFFFKLQLYLFLIDMKSFLLTRNHGSIVILLSVSLVTGQKTMAN